MSKHRHRPAAQADWIRKAVLLVAGLTVPLLALVLFTHAATVTRLRAEYGVTEFKVVEPMMLLPAAGLTVAGWMLRTGRDRTALLLAGASLGLAILFWYVQGAAHTG